MVDRPASEDLLRVSSILPPPLFDLFTQMQPFEQAHAIRVMEGMHSSGYKDEDVLIAALLHDVGKVKHPIRPWERALAVLANRLLPDKFLQRRQGEARGIRKGIVVAANHAAWGADLAAASGANQRVVWLIRYHDTDLALIEGQDRLVISMLQAVDAAN